MTFQTGTSAGYLAFLDDLLQVLTNSHVDTVALVAAGTGYAIGDVVRIDGGTAVGGHTAAVEVLTLSGSAIATMRIYRGGAYTVNPGTAASTTAETGGGSGATITTTIDGTGWTEQRRSQEGVSATPNAAGTGYSTSDKLTLAGGLIGEGGAACIFNVDTVGGSGEVTAVSLDIAGNYEEDPGATGIATTGGGGSGCTLDVVYQDASTQEHVVILEGEGLSGTDSIFVGIKAYSLVVGFDTAWNFCMLGMTGFNSGLPIEEQPGISPGLITTAGSEGETDDNDGAFVPLKDTTGNDITWWVNANGRRFYFFCKVDDGVTTNYFHGGGGLLNQVGTNSEYDSPIFAAGSSSRDDALFNEDSLLLGGITESICSNASSADPTGVFLLRHPDGVWRSHASALSNIASIRTTETEFGIYPTSSRSLPASNDQNAAVASTGNGWQNIIPVSGQPASGTYLLKPTPGSGDAQYWRVQILLVIWELPVTGANYKVLGELDDVFFVSTGGNAVVSEDRLRDGADRYLILQNGNRTDEWSYCAIKEGDG